MTAVSNFPAGSDAHDNKLFSFFIVSQPCLIMLLEGGTCPGILFALCSLNAVSFRANCMCTCDAPAQQLLLAGLLCPAASRHNLHCFQPAGGGGESKTDVPPEWWNGTAPSCSCNLNEIHLETNSQEKWGKVCKNGVLLKHGLCLIVKLGRKPHLSKHNTWRKACSQCSCFTLHSCEWHQKYSWLCRRPAWGTGVFSVNLSPCPKFSILVGRGCVAISADFATEINFALSARYWDSLCCCKNIREE